jgi:alpha 1,3-mannosyltransferase
LLFHVYSYRRALLGDKETFWLGWELVGDTSYSFHPGDAGVMGVMAPPQNSTKQKGYTVCAPQLLHTDVKGKPLWFNGWLLQSKFAENR